MTNNITPSTFLLNEKSHLERNMFFDGSVDIARFDRVKYATIEKLTRNQIAAFWVPEEVDLSIDKTDFRGLTSNEQFIFTSNLKRQILLDSIQGRGPELALLPICSLPELETWISTWTFYEHIHSRSYTHIIRNLYSSPSVIFDDILKIQPIVDCAGDISKYYDDLMNSQDLPLFERKVLLWKCLHAINALEAVRFYVSFACSWAFAENNKMEGNAKIIRMIAKDESLHMSGTIQMIRNLPKEDKDFVKIEKKYAKETKAIFTNVVEQEKSWADFLFEHGSMLGLNAEVLKGYVEWIGVKRAKQVGITLDYVVGKNPLPWTDKWVNSKAVQVAPQETESSEYSTGGISKDITTDTFKGFEL